MHDVYEECKFHGFYGDFTKREIFNLFIRMHFKGKKKVNIENKIANILIKLTYATVKYKTH